MSRRQTHAARSAAPPTGGAALLGALLLVAGCFEPRYQNGGFSCVEGPNGTCPGGFYCASDKRCWKVGEQPPPEGPETDGPVPDGGGDLPPSMPPVLIIPASASPAPVTGTSTVLSVLAEDPQGEGSGLIYHWTVTGPGTVGFSVNSSSSARETTAIFTKAGRYSFTVNILNRDNQSISSMVELDVQAKLNDLAVIPSMATVPLNGTVQFMAMAFDQFGDPLMLSMQPRWQLAGNCGLVNEMTGLFTGGAMMASGCTVLARIESIFTVATVSVGTAPPTVLNPVADSYVDDGSPDKNFGGATVMFVKTQTDSTNNRTAYLKFSLAGVSGPVTSVKLRLFGRAFGGTHSIGVFAVADTSWGETTLTFKNRPPLGMRLARINVTTAPKYHEWDVGPHVQARLAAGDMLLTLAVQMDVPVTVEPDAFDSKEANNKPQLVLTP